MAPGRVRDASVGATAPGPPRAVVGESTMAIVSGECPPMALAEVRAVAASVGWSGTAEELPPRVALLRPPLTHAQVALALQRLGLTHRLVEVWSQQEVAPGTAPLPPPDLPALVGSFAVRVQRLDGAAARLDAPTLARQWGAALERPPTITVDLERPSTELRLTIQGTTLLAGRSLGTVDRAALRERHVRQRPFFRPISLEPTVARALVNLTRTPPGLALLDPCCGTGGLVLEAAALGLTAWGVDRDPEMVEGTKSNLSHFGLQAQWLHSVDLPGLGQGLTHRRTGAGALPPGWKGPPTGTDVGGVVVDLPYGRSSTLYGSTVGEVSDQVLAIAAAVLPPGCRTVVVGPSAPASVPAPLAVEQRFALRVHRSLTRHVTVIRSGGTPPPGPWEREDPVGPPPGTRFRAALPLPRR